jgi:hypothetical protein
MIRRIDHRRRAMNIRLMPLFLLIAGLSACGTDTSPDAPNAKDVTSSTEASPSVVAAEPVLVEPTEDEMRALEAAAIDELNAKGGFVIQMSGAQSEPIKMKLESFRKTECKPYTRAFRCDAEVGTSYPGTEFPDETLPSSHRYQKDAQGRWTRD